MSISPDDPILDTARANVDGYRDGWVFGVLAGAVVGATLVLLAWMAKEVAR